jgi:hypothetical protein
VVLKNLAQHVDGVLAAVDDGDDGFMGFHGRPRSSSTQG